MEEEEEQVRQEKSHANILAAELKAQRKDWDIQEKKRKKMLEEAKSALAESMLKAKEEYEAYLAVNLPPYLIYLNLALNLRPLAFFLCVLINPGRGKGSGDSIAGVATRCQ